MKSEMKKMKKRRKKLVNLEWKNKNKIDRAKNINKENDNTNYIISNYKQTK